MSALTINAHAKINLTLEILSKRGDGYHNLKSVMLEIGLHDTLTLAKVDDAGVFLRVSRPDLPNDSRNIVYRAAAHMRERFGINEGISVEIDKRIPMAAGLGGGSSDCAAVIKGVNRLFGLGLSTGEMAEIGALFGSDVPFFFFGGCALAEGRGEAITPLPRPDMCVLLIHPKIEVSTAEIFRAYRAEDDPYCGGERTGGLAAAIAAGKGLPELSGYFVNSLETAAFARYPEIREAVALLGQIGASARMSGSGASVFACFESAELARAAALPYLTDAVYGENDCGSWNDRDWEVFVCGAPEDGALVQ